MKQILRGSEPVNAFEEYGSAASMKKKECPDVDPRVDEYFDKLLGDWWEAHSNNVIPFNPRKRAAPVTPDKATAARFLGLLDASANAFTFQTFDDNKERLKARAELNKQRKLAGKKLLPTDDFARIRHGSLDQRWNELCKLNAQGAGVFITVNATDGKGRETENIKRVRALFNDLDGAPLEPVMQSKPTPHIVVESSPGRFHPYWLVSDVELKDFTALQKGLIACFDGDKKVHDLPRVMRLPGFIHRKSRPFLSRIVSTHDAPAYKAADFSHFIKADYFDEYARERQQSKSPTQKLNDAALANLAAWVPQLFPTARPYHEGGFRVSSVDLGRNLEEDISFTPEGIKDFGVHDLDDPLEGKRTPVNLVMEHLFEVPVEDIAQRTNKVEFEKACEWLRERVEPEPDEPKLKTKLMQSSAEFVANYVPPDYLIDGLLQRRYVYSLTAPTGSGKTAIALLIAICVAFGLPLGGREVEKGRVLFFAGENPDDVRTRWIMLCEKMGYDPNDVKVVFMPFTLALSEKKIRQQIDTEAAKHGPFSLLIVDTSASYYSGDEENDNVQLGNHARMLRTFVNLPGGPTILVTCHPTKTPNMENLLPRGGGAFLAEVDGNLVCLKEGGSMVVEITWHGKFRGPDFKPFAFKLVPGQSDKLVDTKGRHVWTITAEPITDAEQEELAKAGDRHQDELLRTMLDHPGLSMMELAEKLGLRTVNGEVNKSFVNRMLGDLKKLKLVELARNKQHYELTPKGEKIAEELPQVSYSEVKPCGDDEAPKAQDRQPPRKKPNV